MRHRGPGGFVRAAWLSLVVPPAVAQVAWDVDQQPEPRAGGAMVFDSVRGRAVLFGGDPTLWPSTWEWDGVRWQRRWSSPPARHMHGMAFDAARGRTVLFSGFGVPDDTWEWDGASWTQLQPTVRPAARRRHSMVYDSTRSRVVLFGGADNATWFGDTWEWDGATWTQRAPAVSPSPREDGAMCHDSARGVTVLFGGHDGAVQQGYINDQTWEWNGSTWLQRRPTPRPSWRWGSAMAFDAWRNQCVLFGGAQSTTNTGGLPNETWLWNGTTWTQMPTPPELMARYGAAMAFDTVRGRTLLFGGSATSSRKFGDAWEWDGSTWTRLGHARPFTRSGHAMTFDRTRGVAVLFGGQGPTAGALEGLQDTWESAGGVWQRRQPATAPSPRRDAALAHDLLRLRVVLFGGEEFSLVWPGVSQRRLVDDTFEWDGVDWTARSPAVSPSPRSGHAMAYDPVSARVLLFGGQSTTDLQDTWQWDGANWQLLAPAHLPPSRHRHSLSTDFVRGRVVLFGGTAGLLQPLGDTWEWNGADWTQFAVAGPPPREMAAMAYDEARQRTVLAGGWDWITVRIDTWEWDGAVWTQRAPVGGQPPFFQPTLLYEPTVRRCQVFDGLSIGWYGPLSPAAAEPFGAGCAGSAGAASWQASLLDLPWFGAQFAATVGPLGTGSPTLVMVGWSRTLSGSLTLPAPLGAFGMPGCSLLVSVDAVVALANAGGVAHFSLAIPNAAALLGLAFHVQGATVEPGANAAGIVVSNALACRVGGR